MNAELEAEFAALETVLAYSADGELAWPDADRDFDAFRNCARAASRLGWLNNDGAPEPPPPVSELDSYLLGYGGWLGPDTADVEAHQLAALIVDAEIEYRAEQWEALSRVLDHVDGGFLSWPVDAAERAALFEAVDRLRWHFLPTPLAPNGTPDLPTKKEQPMPTDSSKSEALPDTWAEVKATYSTWSEWDAAQRAARKAQGATEGSAS